MANVEKERILGELKRRFGQIQKMSGSDSLFLIGDGAASLYFRYSKIHPRKRAFFGLRQVDLRHLQGQNSFICFAVSGGAEPVFVPYADFEEVFHRAKTAADGQYKVMLLAETNGRELYIARQGRFNVEGYVGLEPLARGIDTERLRPAREFSHDQMQTLLAGIGNAKGYDVWVPDNNVGCLDWSLTRRFQVSRSLPERFRDIKNILCEIDVVWLERGGNQIEGLYEVEHSTPIYSGLLRFNDVLLTESRIHRFSIVSNDSRREIFSQQLSRPTFRRSGLAELCSFLEYANVYSWHDRIMKKGEGDGKAN
jgi:hypothetical protein